jgi:outer membrane receptor protein involved in Fe transport
VHTCFNNTTGVSKESDFVPKINVAYNFDDDKMVYATYSEGFRRGGVNSAKQGSFAASGELHEYSSDSIKNYEAGFKTTSSDGSFRLNATFYHMIWEDIQLQVFDPVATFFSLGIINLAEAEIDGVEASFSWLPADGWNISGILGYNDAALSEEAIDENLDVALPKGQRLPLMAEWKTNLTVEYTLPQEMFGAEPFVLANWEYRGDSLNSLAGLGGTASLNATRTHPSQHMVNLRAGLKHGDWTATFFIDNVFDDISSSLFNDRWIQVRSTINRPRTFGVNFRKSFGN